LHYWEAGANDWLFCEATDSHLRKDTAERD